MVPARVGGGDDDADGFLVEAFEAAVALEVLQVAAEGAIAHELVELRRVIRRADRRRSGALAADGPAFAFGEGLAQEGEVGERLHGVDAGCLELVAELVEVEAGFEVVHAGVQEAFAVQADPKADGAEARGRGQLAGGEVNLRFLGQQVHVGEDDDADDGLLGDLGAPAGLGAGVVTLAFGEAELEQEVHQVHEVRAGAAEGVVVVVAPAEAEPVLAVLLDARGAVAALPIGALGLEEELAGEVASDEAQDAVEDAAGGLESPAASSAKERGRVRQSSRAWMMLRSSPGFRGAGTNPR